MVAVIAMIFLKGGMEFFGILILLGIAGGMSIVILNYEGNGSHSGELDQLRETVKELDEKIEEIKKLLED